MGFMTGFLGKFSANLFVDACKYGDEVKALSMLGEKPELAFSKDKKGNSAIFQAVAGGNVKIVSAVLKITRNPNEIEREKGWTPLLLASVKGNYELVKLLLSYGADPNIRNYDGATALHFSVYEGQIEIAKLLIDNGADKTIQDSDGNTPVEIAKRRNHDVFCG